MLIHRENSPGIGWSNRVRWDLCLYCVEAVKDVMDTPYSLKRHAFLAWFVLKTHQMLTKPAIKSELFFEDVKHFVNQTLKSMFIKHEGANELTLEPPADVFSCI